MGTIKVAINRDYGGFGLSNEAFEMLIDKKGIPYIIDGTTCNGDFEFINQDTGERLYPWEFYEDRTDKDLIDVIEELGNKANSWISSLKVIEIPDNVEWEIGYYDGKEWVAEVHRTWQ